MEHVSLEISRSGQARFLRLCFALGVVGLWLGLQLADVVLSLMLWSEPNFPEVLVYTSPVLLVVPWILRMALARGRVTVEPDRLTIRHPRVLRRDLVVPREQVARVIVDDGAATGRARFATGDPAEPLLWTDPVVTRQYADRPLIGDALLPNLALVLASPSRDGRGPRRSHVRACVVRGRAAAATQRTRAAADDA